MGSWASLNIMAYHVAGMKSHVDPVVMTLFQAGDRLVGLEEEPGGDSDYEDARLLYRYVAPAEYVKQRLDILGFTLERTQQVFEEAIDSARQQYSRNRSRPGAG
jgi:hypothetical protein